jgi:hypothetical protein
MNSARLLFSVISLVIGLWSASALAVRSLVISGQKEMHG